MSLKKYNLKLCFLIVISIILTFVSVSCGAVKDENLKYKLNKDTKKYVVTGVIDNSITEIVIPSEYKGKPVSEISSNAFADCEKLENIIIPDSIVFIGEDAFKNCKIKNATIPNIAVSAVKSEILENVVVASGTSIESEAFSQCYNLKSVILSDSITSIGESAFYHCSSLVEITIPEGVTAIKDATFQFCINLTAINLPSDLKAIGEIAFAGCSSLKELIIPNSVENIGYAITSLCTSLERVKFDGTFDRWFEIQANLDWARDKRFYRLECSDVTAEALPKPSY